MTATSGSGLSHLVLPSSLFGADYVVTKADAFVTSLDVIAVSSDSSITIQFPRNPSSFVVRTPGGLQLLGGDQLSLNLFAGERMTFSSEFDLTGTTIHSVQSDLVAAFVRTASGQNFQLVPSCTWGRHHVTIPMTFQTSNQSGYLLRVTALDWTQSTKMSYKTSSNVAPAEIIISGGQTVDLNVPDLSALYIESDSPVHLIQTTSFATTWVIPVELYTNVYAIAVPNATNIVIISNSAEDILVNGEVTNPITGWKDVYGSSMMYAYVNIWSRDFVVLEMSNGSMFGAYIYVSGSVGGQYQILPAGTGSFYNKVSSIISPNKIGYF